MECHTDRSRTFPNSHPCRAADTELHPASGCCRAHGYPRPSSRRRCRPRALPGRVLLPEHVIAENAARLALVRPEAYELQSVVGRAAAMLAAVLDVVPQPEQLAQRLVPDLLV